jgi:choline monooxygenase
VSIVRNIDGKAYSDAAVFALEREKIFSRSWQLLGAANEVSAPGQYVATNIAGYPIFVLRGHDGVLRAFRNVCPHRGAPLVEAAAGNCAEIKCPYHALRFDDGGALKTDEAVFGLPVPPELHSLHLAAVPVELWRGLLFVALAPTVSLIEQLGDLPAQVGTTLIEKYVKAERRQVMAAVNWKTYFDQYNEVWHTPQIHPTDKNVGIQEYRAEAFRGLVRMMTGTAAGKEAAYYGGKWMQCWPNWTLVLFAGGMKTVRINPLSAVQIEAHHDFYFEDMAAEQDAQRKQVADATLSIFSQDVGICERVMANYLSGSFNQGGPMHPQHETALIEYQNRVREALRS